MDAPKINLAAIAKMAELSTAAVSNFINCAENFPLSAAKQKKIMEAMRAANYRPNSASGQLRRNAAPTSRAIFIFGSYPESPICNNYRNPLLSELLLHLSNRLGEQLGMQLELRPVDDIESYPVWTEAIADGDAVICYGKLNEKLLKLSLRRNIPLVVISETGEMPVDAPTDETSEQDMVYWNARQHLSAMLDRLVSRGAKSLAFISSCNIRANHPKYFAIEAEAKIACFREFLAAHREVDGRLLCPPDEEPVIHIDYEARNTFEFLKDIDLRQFDAVAGHNDAVAQGVAWALQHRGLRVGRDVMVSGEGDYLHCRHAIPQITTISYDKEKMADEICRILKRKQQKNHPQGERISIPSKLIERESTNPNF